MRRNRIGRPAVLMVLALAPAAAQETVSSVRVFSDAPDATLSVDGAYLRGGATFLWPRGSKHTLFAPQEQTDARFGSRYRFRQWEDSRGQILEPGNRIDVTADPAIAYFKAVYTVEYKLTLAFYYCAAEEPACVSPAGRVYIDSQPYTSGTVLWIPAGNMVAVQAVPAQGYVFAGWNNTMANGTSSFAASFRMDGPRTLSPRFVPAKTVEILTEPAGLTILADRSPMKAPAVLEWGWESTHTLGVVSPQTDLYGKTWVFSGWSDGGAAVHGYSVAAGSLQETIVATFVPAARASFLTSPPGLRLNIDGRENWQSYNFWWPAGETHRVSAPPEQKDAQGRTYRFQGWSNGRPETQDIVLTDADLDGFRLTAHYELLGRLALTSEPAGLPLRIDGRECKTPCVMDRPAGSEVRFSAPRHVELYDGARLTLSNWLNPGDLEQPFRFTSAAETYHAAYRLMHRLIAVPDRPDAAAVSAEPASADGFYDSGSDVRVTVEPRPGFRFQRWDGDASGMYRTISVRMTAPRFARAVLEAVPFVPPAGARNAAAETPGNAVAPGSVVSVFGANLASVTEAGPLNPLAQTLGGLVVRLGTRLLPLLFVSPEQVNLLLPYDLEAGAHRLQLESAGREEIGIDIVVQRNAPGLFSEPAAEDPIALATRQDGSRIVAESPARRGEEIALLGTGFGPYDRPPVAGFAIPAGAVYRAADTVELLAGGAAWPVHFAGAAELLAGIDVVRFRVPPEAPSGLIPLTVRINGVESNSVLLLVE